MTKVIFYEKKNEKSDIFPMPYYGHSAIGNKYAYAGRPL